MQQRKQTIRPIVTIITSVLALLLALQGLTVNAGSVKDKEIRIGTPHAITGFVYWPNGTKDIQLPVPVTITNNRTGESGVVLLDTGPGAYQVDLSTDAIYPSGYLVGDPIYVNCSYMHMEAHNETTVSGVAFSMCDLWLDSPYVGQWHLDEGSGQYAMDTSGYSNHGTLGIDENPGLDDPTWSNCISGTALSFDGNDLVTVPQAPSLNFSNGEFTFEGWIRWDGSYNIPNPIFMTKNNTAGQYEGWRVRFNDGAVDYRARFVIDDGPNDIGVSTTTLLNDGSWHHLVFVRNATHILAYVDGLFEASTLATSVGSTDSIADLIIGELFEGVIDEVQLWDRALNSTEIMNIYNNLWNNYVNSVLNGTHGGVDYAYPGQTKVPMLNIEIENNESVLETLETINVQSKNVDDLDVGQVQLWLDDGDGVLNAGDVQQGAAVPFASGWANFTGLITNVLANTTINVFVSYDIAAGATPGNTIDLMIPAGNLTLNNTGPTVSDIDPVGFTTIKQENLTDPHAVYGYVQNVVGPLPFAWVNLTNNRTGVTENLTTDSLGRYDVNVGLMSGGYLDGDPIYVQANDTFGQIGWNTTVVDAMNYGEQCDVFVGAGPMAGDETPANGSITTDVYANVTLNITSMLQPNLTTIVLEVNGTLYYIGDGHLEYTNVTPTLTFLNFNTSSVGPWYHDQTVNVTLWYVNDTIGNPCQNAPYSWWFNVTAFGVGRPANLTLSNNSGAVRLDWDAVIYANGYNVYRSNDRFAAWPWAKVADNITATNWTDGAVTYLDPNTYCYIVTAWNPAGEGGNSSLGTKIRKPFTYIDETLNTNINWVSLPYNSNYATISDIIDDIEGGTFGPGHARFISAVYLWDSAAQGIDGMTGNNFLGWAGNNLAINPGDAIRFDLSNVMNPGESFNWTVVGTDVNSTQNFTYIDETVNTNINWVSVPYGTNYSTLSDIITQIEGGLVGPGHAQYISAVYKWDSTTQGIDGMTGNNFLGWAGNDLTINPGDAIRFDLSNVMNPGDAFSWNPWVLTSPVPDIHYYDS